MASDPATQSSSHASMEALVETGMLALESLHPGGLSTTRELAESCGITAGSKVLDLASGTGETACYLGQTCGAIVSGIDRSPEMIRRSREKAASCGIEVLFKQADAVNLPFSDGEFDAAICECTLCLLSKQAVLSEMLRVVRPGGRVGIHDLSWKENTPERLKRKLADIEGEYPETLAGWRQLFEEAGMTDIEVMDKSDIVTQWMQESRRQLKLSGQLKLAIRVARRWGLRGLWRILQSERVFSSRYLGYCLIVGTKPSSLAG